MTKRLNSKHKVDRRLKVNLWGRPKSPFNTRAYGPGQHGQTRSSKPSDFGIQLQAKQKLKAYYGNINERRHQLHEVIRLSGMNLVINDIDHPLIIKVASIPSARMQVYFIDNEEYFSRKAVLTDKTSGKYFDDNDERAMFFVRGVAETVKKLGWSPDIIHLHGWFTALFPFIPKSAYPLAGTITDIDIVSVLDPLSFIT